MTKTSQKVTSPVKQKFKENKNMTASVGHKLNTVDLEIKNSIHRGNFLRYSLFIQSVKNNLEGLKKSNPKYLSLIDNIIQISITDLPALDIEVPLNILLSQLNEASYNNHEALDFTEEVLNSADILTSKYYLATLAGGILQNNNLKQQFKASIPFVKYILASLKESSDLSKQINFINALKIMINEKADYKKIELLPKIKYVIDNISRQKHNIDVTRLIYSKTSAKKIELRLETITSDIKSIESSGGTVDCTDYLIQNSL